MTTTNDAMREALDALEERAGYWGEGARDLKASAISKLRAALAQQAAPTVPHAESVLAALDALGDEAAAHIFPCDLEKCSRSECVVKVASVRMGSSDGDHTVPLFSREQVAEALLSASPAAPEAAPRLQWCEHCGEGVIDFCRGKTDKCPYGFKTIKQQAEPCPDSRSNDYACKNRHQCWEPCGELGNSEAHVTAHQEPLDKLARLKEDMGLYPQQQAQAEPEVVAYTWFDPAGVRHLDYIAPSGWTAPHATDIDPLITLQAHREAMSAEAEKFQVLLNRIEPKIDALIDVIAKKDAALQACVEALQASTDPLVETTEWFQRASAAITQANEAMK